jgi:hypothetical protein
MSDNKLPSQAQTDAMAKALSENPVYVSPQTGKAYTEKPADPTSVDELAQRISQLNKRTGE